LPFKVSFTEGAQRQDYTQQERAALAASLNKLFDIFT